MIEYQIDNFAIRHWATRSTNNDSPGVAVAGIYLYEGETYRGYIYFYPDGTDLRPPADRREQGQIQLAFNLSQLDSTLRMLENRSPVTLYYRSQTDAGIKVGRDPFAQ
ncbi:MAG: hypothetical protein KDD92_09880 [Caldilineaceae bacterium]|nr:hypothetical protein [Caldilineaceae bacterium]